MQCHSYILPYIHVFRLYTVHALYLACGIDCTELKKQQHI